MRTVATAINDNVVGVTRLGGGDVAEAFRVESANGGVFFAKTHTDPPPLFFSTEAAGLKWMREAEATRVPAVVGVSDEPPMLVLEWIDEGGRGEDDSSFGRQLAEMHGVGASGFGRSDGRVTTSRALPNDHADSWVEFYGDRRLSQLNRLATQAGAIPASVADGIERVISNLGGLVGPPEPPSRLHGDLWAGNRLTDRFGESWLIDPACFGGHREFDLAMMRLFGGFGESCFDAYQRVFPLAPEWEQRIPLYQLAPLITHSIKFGGGYVESTARAVETVLAYC